MQIFESWLVVVFKLGQSRVAGEGHFRGDCHCDFLGFVECYSDILEPTLLLQRAPLISHYSHGERHCDISSHYYSHGERHCGDLEPTLLSHYSHGERHCDISSHYYSSSPKPIDSPSH